MLINCAGFALAYYAWERVRSAAAEVGAAFLHKRRERFFGRWAAQQLAKGVALLLDALQRGRLLALLHQAFGGHG